MTSYGAASFTYTANGELLARVDPEGTTGFDYDVLGSLREVVLPDGTAIEYLVDARHRRIGRKVDGTLERGWLWASQLAPAAELDGTGQVVSRYVHATRVNVPDLILRDGMTYRLLTDPLGSPRLAIDATTGAVVQRMDYDEWGVVLLDTNPGWQPFGFGGGLYDADTELVRFGWRDYDPVAGRWASKDPIRFASRTSLLYEFADGDPMNQRDPNGMMVGGGRFWRYFVRPLAVAACEGIRKTGEIARQRQKDHEALLKEDGDMDRVLYPESDFWQPARDWCDTLDLTAADQLRRQTADADLSLWEELETRHPELARALEDILIQTALFCPAAYHVR